jgi:RNA polymerase sigma-70 factor (ECF subfamily)
MRFALRLTRVRADAEDLVSDTILRALQRRDQYRFGTNMRRWLCTILYRLYVTQGRIDQMRARLAECGSAWSAHGADSGSDPEGHFYDALIDAPITQALNDLPCHIRLAIVLSDMRDLDCREIAEMLRVPVGTVKSRIFRGRRMLRTKLARYAAEIGYIPVPAAA